MRVRRKTFVGGALLLGCVTLLLLLSSPRTQNVQEEESEDPLLEQRLLDLQTRLHEAELLSKRREDELYALLSRLGPANGAAAAQGRKVATLAQGEAPAGNSTRSLTDYSAALQDIQRSVGGLQLPGIHSYLPHLTGHPEYLRPAVHLSKGRKGVSIAIGVPTIKREKSSYLVQTLSSLIQSLTAQESDDCLIVVFIAEPWDLKYADSVITLLKTNFPQSLDSGLLEVIVPPAGFYPNLDNLKETFGDTKERVKWRTKQNLDYAFLMLHSRPRAMYYVQMEDDVIAKPGYLTIMITFAKQQKEEWIMLEFSTLGFIGKMFKSSDVPTVVEFFLMFHADKPIDWLLDHLLWVKVCNPEKDAKHCQRMIQAVRRRFKPSLFQHIGTESSLKGKVQKLKDRDFGKAGLYRAHVNPAVQLASSLKTYLKYTLPKAYTGETFFWASSPNKGDIIDFKFTPPINIEKYLFRSGNTDHPGDVFRNTTLEIQPAKNVSVARAKALSVQSGVYTAELADTSPGFIAIGRFNDHGLAQGEIIEELNPIKVLRIHVHQAANAWVILSEIMIQEAKSRR
ncbi:alpha-1,3-mannosyl-glycoprotein 4-beta-n-acetylglucosaminyltransferase b [Plakobranchus ocellatus]|uniref:Alpha-1,3-mannosyl-glycoprotein 4-beta-n-acetylglucosaminyltransferase b n=1 Tax=Plakobranchus ocellatus TaxID=259542 RepID=A0AAV4APJ3_9GAST|nr:alpha-1,3-mannosyl-glycoprotein 4-beta-n-acetylglucosaminyltransferase b [Plakobranchus ocellatus]